MALYFILTKKKSTISIIYWDIKEDCYFTEIFAYFQITRWPGVERKPESICLNCCFTIFFIFSVSDLSILVVIPDCQYDI